MFMTGCVVLVMSSCHDKDTDNMMYLFMSCCHNKEISNKVIFCIKNVITEQMKLNDSCHTNA